MTPDRLNLVINALYVARDIYDRDAEYADKDCSNKGIARHFRQQSKDCVEIAEGLERGILHIAGGPICK